MVSSSRTVRPSAASLSAALQALILKEGLRPGDRLPGEEALCQRFGCSRPALREALQRLKAQGLIVSRRGSGNYLADGVQAGSLRESVKIYSSLQSQGASYLELLDLRLMIEVFCVGRLAARKEAAPRKRLREKLNVMRACKNDLVAFGRADIDFHQTLVEGADHGLFSNILSGLLAGLGLRFAEATYTSPDLVEKNLKDHVAICRAVEAGQPRLAQRLLRQHLLDSRRHLEAML
jgi:GntR family L-lactate dehydrogenase operon transcriptional regulator